MNKLEVADLIEQIPQELTPDDFLVALATKAEEAEREACAKVCDTMATPETSRDAQHDFHWAAGCCAAAIRARGQA